MHSYVYLIFHKFYYTSLVDAEFAVGVIPVTSVNSCYKLVCVFGGWVGNLCLFYSLCANEAVLSAAVWSL